MIQLYTTHNTPERTWVCVPRGLGLIRVVLKTTTGVAAVSVPAGNAAGTRELYLRAGVTAEKLLVLEFSGVRAGVGRT